MLPFFSFEHLLHVLVMHHFVLAFPLGDGCFQTFWFGWMQWIYGGALFFVD
jgi:hypothetical protein